VEAKMILGEFVDGKIVVPVIFCLDISTDLTISFVLDTGFNNCLALPPSAVAALNLQFYSMMTIRLADGSQSLIQTYTAKIRWGGREELVMVLATGTKPLLGTLLMQGFRLTAEFVRSGTVSIEKI
jgi:clan AA aspartic protease